MTDTASINLRTGPGTIQTVQLSSPLPREIAPGDLFLAPFNGVQTLFICAEKQWTWDGGGYKLELSAEIVDLNQLPPEGIAGIRSAVLKRAGWIS